MRPRTIKKIVLHCSATQNGVPVTVETIDSWHNARGFKRDPKAVKDGDPAHIGYHFVILLDGTIHACRGLDEVGAHAAGHNAESIGICLVGGVDSKGATAEKKAQGVYSSAQWRSLENLVRDLRVKTGGAKLVGHRDLSPDLDKDGVVEKHEWLKTCPGFDVGLWMAYGMKPLPGWTLGEAP
jgi:N-acetylmuramoyl-L-alanine amidase